MPLTKTKAEIKQEMRRLLADDDGVVTLLAAGLMVSDFDDPDLALDEALKTFNGNRGYFRALKDKLPTLFKLKG